MPFSDPSWPKVLAAQEALEAAQLAERSAPSEETHRALLAASSEYLRVSKEWQEHLKAIESKP